MEKKENRVINWWKWAFIALVALIVVLGGVFVTKATAPNTKTEISQPIKQSAASFSVELNRDQINALSKNYLNNFLKDKKVKYQFIVGKQYATLIGNTKFLGSKIRFAINFVPQKTKEGNVLLKAKGLAIGQLNIPIKFVMSYVAQNYKLPNWVTINPKKKTVLLDLNRYSKNRQLKYSAQEINMQEGKFKFHISVPAN